MTINKLIYASALLMCSTNMTAQTTTLPGDVDGDGHLTKNDVTLLADVLSGKTTNYANPAAADFDNNGKVSIKDLTLLIDALLHPTTGESNGHTWVDLGLSVKWATCNIGASTPSENGGYYAWGETATKSSYTWNNYLGATMTSWSDCGTTKDPLKNFVYPNETSIASTQYDIAHTQWKGTWRMPTFEEQSELCNNCYWEWTNNYNGTKKAGYIIYKVKDKSDRGKYSYGYTAPTATYTLTDTHIFLPASGYRSGTALYSNGYVGRYWSADPTTGSAADVFTLNFDSSLVLWLSYFRNDGYSVRAVIE